MRHIFATSAMHGGRKAFLCDMWNADMIQSANMTCVKLGALKGPRLPKLFYRCCTFFALLDLVEVEKVKGQGIFQKWGLPTQLNSF